MKPLISLTTDFAVQSQGVGAMEAIIYQIAPEAKVIHLMHGVNGFDVIAAARTLETTKYFPVGFHVCVCDPGVGTSRKALACQVMRGDYLIGPDNGVLIPASRILGGVVRAFSLENPDLMRQPVSPIFHGRDIFAPAAAHLSLGIDPHKFGPEVPVDKLVEAPYGEAEVSKESLVARIIQINKFGSMHLNVLYSQWDSLPLALGKSVRLKVGGNPIAEVTHTRTFGEVAVGKNVIMRDDYGRVEIAKNLGSFLDEFPAKIGDKVEIFFS